MKTKTMLSVFLIVLSMASLASAEMPLWDQTEGYEGWSMGFFNNIAGSPPFGSTMYTCNDIVVPADGGVINTVSIYYDGFNPGWAGAVTEAVLFVEAKTGSTPTGDPSTGTSVAVECIALDNGFLELTATGLEMVMTEGEYWIGLTPVTPNADNIHVSVVAIGDDSPTYDAFGFPAPMWAGWAAGLDGAMLIEGYMGTVSNIESTLGQVKSLYR